MMKREYSAGVIVYYKEESAVDLRKYLLLQWPNGYWDLPKGHLEGSETALQAAERELKEETGLTAVIIPGFEQSLHYNFKSQGELVSKTVTFFVGRADTMDVTLSYEHVGFKWLPFAQAVQQLTYVNAQRIVRLADEYIDMYEHQHLS